MFNKFLQYHLNNYEMKFRDQNNVFYCNGEIPHRTTESNTLQDTSYQR